jgi:hypothetical protein
MRCPDPQCGEPPSSSLGPGAEPKGLTRVSNRSKRVLLVVMSTVLLLTGCGSSATTESVVVPDGGGGAATSAPASVAATAVTGAASGGASGSSSGAGGALASALVGAGGSGTGAAAASFTVIAPPGDIGVFQLPSGNLGCTVQPDGVRCDIMQRTWKPSPQPASCEFDWGQGMVVGPDGADFSCVSDTLLGSGPTVAYGTLVKGSGYACEVTVAGVNCYSLTSKHGFRLSRTLAQAY